MKVFLIVFSLLFSVDAFSANAYLMRQGFGWDTTYAGGSAGGGYSCDEISCQGQQLNTFWSYHVTMDGNPPADNEQYFFDPNGIDIEEGGPLYKGYFREFVSGNDFSTLQDFNYTVTYESFGLENLRFYAGEISDRINLSAPSGTFSGSVLAGKWFSIGMLGLLSDISFADDAFLSYKLTINPISVSEVPLPASLFLFAPALLGLIGYRQKLS